MSDEPFVMQSEPDARTATAHDFADARFAIHAITARIRQSAHDDHAWLVTVAEELANVRLDLDELQQVLRRRMFHGVVS